MQASPPKALVGITLHACTMLGIIDPGHPYQEVSPTEPKESLTSE